jgi:O-antigen/teichoic acid export membrane protein
VGVTLGPTISRLWAERDMARLRLAVTRGSRGALAFAVAVAIGLIAFGPQFLLLFGAEFVAARDTLALLAVSQVVDAGLGMGGVILGMTGHQSIALRAGVVAAIVRVAIGVALIPIYGANGAAIAAIASMAAFNGLMAVAVIRRLRVDPTPAGLPLVQ